MSEPYDVTTPADAALGRRRLADRTGKTWVERACRRCDGHGVQVIDDFGEPLSTACHRVRCLRCKGSGWEAVQ